MAAVLVGSLALVGALLPVGVGAVGLAAETTVDLTSDAAQRWLGEYHYGVFRGESRVGWLRRSLVLGVFDGQPAVVRTVESFVDVAGDGNAVRTTERVVYQASGEQLMLEIERGTTRQGVRTSRRVTRQGGRFDVVTTREGKAIEGAVAAIRVTLSDELVVERLIAAAAVREEGATGAEASSSALDLRQMRATVRSLVVQGTEVLPDTADTAGKTDATETEGEAAIGYLVAVKAPGGRTSEPVLVDADGAMLRGAMGGGLRLRRMSADEALSDVGRTSIEVALRVPLDGSIGDPETLTELSISLPAPPEDAPPPFPTTGRQTVSVVDGRLVLRVRVAVDAGEATPDERAAALLASPGIDPEEPSIVAAATRVLAGTSRRGTQVRRLLQFTAAHITDTVVLDDLSATEILQLRRGDCTEHTRLFIALARASGIPAREVMGLFFMGDDQAAFGWHAWAEVELLGRWRPADPTGGTMPASAAHLRVDQVARAAGVLDDVRFKLEEARR